jgi:hypothetical protein
VTDKDTLKGVGEIITNYHKMTPHSIEKMLGKDGAKKLSGHIKALELIKEVESLKEVPVDVKSALTELAGAVATLKISVTGGSYRLVNLWNKVARKDIASINKEKLRLIKRVKEVENSKSRELMLKALKGLNVTKEELTKGLTGKAALGVTAADRDERLEEDQ